MQSKGNTIYLGPIANPSATTYTVSFIEPITGFTLGGASVSTPGLNGTPGAFGSYGLYVAMDLLTQAVGLPNIYRYISGTVRLMADPGNNNGALSSTIAGLSFANTGPTGTGDDITLATGSLVSGTFTANPAPGIRSVGDFVETLQPAAGESGFFVTPTDLIEEILTTPLGAIAFAPDPSDPTLQFSMINGGTATAAIDLQVPEPESVLLLGVGLIGIATLCRVRSRRPH